MEKITEEQFRQIFEETEAKWNGDNAMIGLIIISKYFDIRVKTILEGAGHDVIYSVDVSEIVEAGITWDDAVELRKHNWMIDEEAGDCLACFV